MKFAVNGNKIATLIDRGGKDEIKVYKVDKTGGSEVIASVSLDDIVDFIWGNTNSSSTKKKRSVNGTNKENNKTQQDLLIVLLKNSDIVIISNNSEINRFNLSEDEGVAKLLKYDDDGYIWASSSSNNSIVKVSVLKGEIKDRFKVPDFNSINIFSKKIALGTSTNLKIGKFTKGKFSGNVEIPIEESIVDVLQDSTNLVVLTSDKNAYIMEGNKFQKIARDVNNIQFLNYRDQNYIITIGKDNKSISFFSNDNLENSISTTSVVLDGLVSVDDSLIVFWSGKNELLFKKISWTDNELTIPNGTVHMNGSKPHIEVPKNKVKKIDASDLLATLTTLENDNSSIVDLCASINDQNVIKTVTKELGLKLYPAINEAVINDVTNTNLAIWLKWILLFNGGNPSIQQDNNVKILKQQLESGSKIMPHLIAIKGKLQLLKLQNEMRKNRPVGEITTTIEDDSMIYANGEAE
ncbi:hypothetical protein SBY92_000501 [Candida maltosa Xu316]